eukprot:COSAG03_NODE_10637_length_638_cov_0.766234_1_plen_108_part_01
MMYRIARAREDARARAHMYDRTLGCESRSIPSRSMLRPSGADGGGRPRARAHAACLLPEGTSIAHARYGMARLPPRHSRRSSLIAASCLCNFVLLLGAADVVDALLTQ